MAENLPLLQGDRLPGAEQTDMGRADIGDYRDIRAEDFRQNIHQNGVIFSQCAFFRVDFNHCQLETVHCLNSRPNYNRMHTKAFRLAHEEKYARKSSP